MADYKGKSTIGLRDVCYAMLTEGDTANTYGTVHTVAGAIDATITPNAETSKQYADDGVFDSYSSLGDIQISLEMAALPSAVLVDWLGYRKDAKGVVIKDKDAQGGYFALGFRAMRSDDTYQYTWVYKCKASAPEENAHTKEGGSITYTTRTVTIDAMPRLLDGKWQATLCEGDEGVESSVITTFLDAVYEEATGGGG